MQLRFEEPVIAFHGNGQTLVKRLSRLGMSSELRVCVGQNTEIVVDTHAGSGRTERAEPFQHDRESRLRRTLQQYPDALVQRSQCVPELESLIRCDGELFFGRCLHCTTEPAVMRQTSAEVHRVLDRKGMADLSRQRTGLAIELYCLVGEDEQPPIQGQIAAMGNAGVVAGMGSPCLGLFAL